MVYLFYLQISPYLFTYLFICLLIDGFIYIFIHLFLHLSYLSAYLCYFFYIITYTYLFDSLCIYLFISLFISSFLCLLIPLNMAALVTLLFGPRLTLYLRSLSFSVYFSFLFSLSIKLSISSSVSRSSVHSFLSLPSYCNCPSTSSSWLLFVHYYLLLAFRFVLVSSAPRFSLLSALYSYLITRSSFLHILSTSSSVSIFLYNVLSVLFLASHVFLYSDYPLLQSPSSVIHPSLHPPSFSHNVLLFLFLVLLICPYSVPLLQLSVCRFFLALSFSFLAFLPPFVRFSFLVLSNDKYTHESIHLFFSLPLFLPPCTPILIHCLR